MRPTGQDGTIYNLWITGNPEKQHHEIYQIFGIIDVVKRRYEEASIAFDSVIAIEPKQMAAYEGKSEVYVATENYEEAEKTL